MLLVTPLHKYFLNSIFVKTHLSLQQAGKNSSKFGLITVFATLCFYIAIGGIWTFMANLSSFYQINTDFTNLVLASSTLLGILGSLLTSIIGTKFKRNYLIIIGFIFFAISLFLLLNHVTDTTFAISVLIFKFSWMFTVPYILATVASFDYTGKFINSVNLAIGGGLALGPFIAGFIIENTLNYDALITYTALIFLFSFVLIFGANLKK
ncbi:hypothetical protein GCM10023206_03030 [Acinetobacter puyangensis]|nr:MFS transporter [Acinetobacter puyangensis]